MGSSPSALWHRLHRPWVANPLPLPVQAAGSTGTPVPLPSPAMVPASNPAKFPPALPEWTNWIQVGLTALLAVLFLVILDKGRQQSGRIQLLEQRVQGLENSRALDRTTALEQQLRSSVERLQRLERSTARIDSLSAEGKELQRQLFQLRTEALKQNSSNPELPPMQPLPPLKPSPGLPSLNP